MKALSLFGILVAADLIVTVPAARTVAQDSDQLASTTVLMPSAALTEGSDLSVSDSTAIAETIDRFREAIANGDSLMVAGLLLDEVVILESGSPETKHQFLSSCSTLWAFGAVSNLSQSPMVVWPSSSLSLSTVKGDCGGWQYPQWQSSA